MSEANNITFAQAKTSFFYRPKVKRKYNTRHLAGKEALVAGMNKFLRIYYGKITELYRNLEL